MAINDITGDRLVNKVSKDSTTYGENLEKILMAEAEKGYRDWETTIS